MPTPRALPLVAAVLAVAIVVLHVRVVAGGQTWADPRYHTEVAPPRLAAAEAVQAGELPAWWEGSGLGVPLAAEPSHGAMYPLAWIAATPRALDLLAIAHLLWGALGIAVWARRRTQAGGDGASEPAALAAGLLAATSGLLASAAVRGALPALAHLPWIGVAAAALAGAEDRRGRVRAAVALGALLGLVATAGVLAALGVGVALAVAVGARRGAGPALAAAIAAGLAVGAAQWLPALAQLGELAGGEVQGLPLARLVELIVPGAFGAGDPERGIPALAGGAPWAPSLFAGAPLLALAAVRTPPRRVLAVIGALAALVLLAGRGGWPAWLGAPELYAAMLVVVLAANAGAGLDALMAGERRALLALGAGIGCAGVALAALGAQAGRHPEAEAAIEHALLDGALGLIAMLLAFGLAWRAREAGPDRATPLVLVLLVLPSAGAVPSTAPLVERAAVEAAPAWADAAAAVEAGGAPRRMFRPAHMYLRGEDAAVEVAVATLGGGSAWRWGLGAARSEDPARPRAHDATWLAAAQDGGALLDRFGISLAILPETLVGARHMKALAVRGDWALVAFPAAPAASVMRGALWVDTDADALALLFPPDGKLPRGTAVLGGRGLSRPDRAPPRPCEIRRWRAGDIELACAADADGHAVISSTGAEGWAVTVDGVRAAWATADVLRRAVAVPAGEHVVRWTYEAPLLGEGLGLALAGLAGLGAGLGYLAATRRRERRRAQISGGGAEDAEDESSSEKRTS